MYFLGHRALGAYEVGITNVGTKRLAAFQLRGWQVLSLELFEDGTHAHVVERAIKRWWRIGLGLLACLGRADMPQTGGWSETVAADVLSEFACIDRIRTEATAARNAAPAAASQVAIE